MGQIISSSGGHGAQSSEIENGKTPEVSASKVAAMLEKFNMDSKSGIGVHMFCFTPPAVLQNNGAFGNTSTAGAFGTAGHGKIYIASEVTDDNDVLDVKYSEWKKKFVATAENESEKRDEKQQSSASMFPLWRFVEPQSKLRIVWSPTHRFSSGRLAMVAVQALLNQGYTMKECDPESEMKI